MKAIVHDAYGPPDDVLALRDIAVPTIEDDEVLVEVHAAAVSTADGHLVRGEPFAARPATGLRVPRRRVPGRSVAGRVQAVGPTVTRLAPGDEVFGWCAGAFAEHVAVPEASLELRPVGLTAPQAAVLPGAGTTALQAVRDGGMVRPGHHVLVIGATGAVGTFAVQIAIALGATVTGVCSTANVGLLQALGAAHVIDYTQHDLARDVGRYDVIVDLVGDRPLSRLRRGLTPDGSLVLLGPGSRWPGRRLAARLLAPFAGARLVPLVPVARRSDLAALRDLVAAGSVTPVVSAHFTLAEVAAAIAHFAPGHARGTIAITL